MSNPPFFAILLDKKHSPPPVGWLAGWAGGLGGWVGWVGCVGWLAGLAGLAGWLVAGWLAGWLDSDSPRPAAPIRCPG